MSELSKQTISLDKQLDSAIERLNHRLEDFKVIVFFFIVLVNFHFLCLKKLFFFYRTRLFTFK